MQDHKIRRGANKEENRMMLLSEQRKKISERLRRLKDPDRIED
jgi:hypothetical protein